MKNIHPNKHLHECYCGSRPLSACALKAHLESHNPSKIPKGQTFICQSCGKGKKNMFKSLVLNWFNFFLNKDIPQEVVLDIID